MDRNRVFTIGIIVIAVLFIMRPFGRNRNKERIIPPAVRSEQLLPVVTHLDQKGEPPEEYVAGLFSDHDIVFVGEFHKIKQQLEFAADLIPVLHRRGVRHLGLEQALYEDQDQMDRLLTATTFDEKAARQIFFNFVVVWGFEEYVDLLRAAWEVNQNLPAGSEPFRIVGLNVRRDWRQIQSEADLEDPEVIARVFAKGIPEVFMADVIQKEFVEPGHKALVYMNIQSATTRYRNNEYANNAAEKGLPETRKAGNIVYDAIGRRAVFVALHAPWPNRERLSQVYFPVGGVLDRALLDLPEEKQRVGFTVMGSPMSALEIKSEIYTTGYDQLTLGDYADGYVILGPLAKYEPVTPILDFITDNNVEQARADYPAPLPTDEAPSATELNSYIQKDLELMKRSLDQFK